MLPTSSAQFTSRKPSARSAVGVIDLSSGNAQSSQFHDDAFERAERGWNFDQIQATGWSGPNIEPEAMRKSRE